MPGARRPLKHNVLNLSNGERFTLDTIVTTGVVAKLCCIAPRTVTLWCDSGNLINHRLPKFNKDGERKTEKGEERRIIISNLIAFLLRFGMPVPEILQPLLNHDIAMLAGIPMSDMRYICESLSSFNRESVIVDSSHELGFMLSQKKPSFLAIDFGLMGKAATIKFVRLARIAYPHTYIVGICGSDEDRSIIHQECKELFDEMFQSPLDVANFVDCALTNFSGRKTSNASAAPPTFTGGDLESVH